MRRSVQLLAIFKAYFAPATAMAISFEDLRRTAKSIVDLAAANPSSESIQLQRFNVRECELLAKKASETLTLVDEFEQELKNVHSLQAGIIDSSSALSPDWTPAATELHRVLKDAEVLTRDCCCCDHDNWLKMIIVRGNLKETFARLLYELEWHTWVLCSLLRDKMEPPNLFIAKERERCDGNLRLTDSYLLSVAAKQDRESLRTQLLTASSKSEATLSGEDCLAAKLLEKLDAEKRDNPILHRFGSFDEMKPHFLWVSPQDLHKGRKIATGNFAKVRETEWLGQKFAQKVFVGTKHGKNFQQEVAAIIGLSHPNVVRVVCCSEGDHHQEFSIIMDLMYKSLFDLLNEDFSNSASPPFTLVQAVDLMLQIAEGLRYLHGINLVHRDLKSLNILVQIAGLDTTLGGNVGKVHITETTPIVAKIADFGLSKVKNISTQIKNQTADLGTTLWNAPEVPHSGGFDEIESQRFHPMKLDVYSFSIICYEILSGDVPFADVPRTEVARRVRAGLRPELPDGIPGRLAVLIRECWNGNPMLRPDFPAICTELRFVKGRLLQDRNSEADINSNPLKSEIKVQGPWGQPNSDAEMFCDGIVTSIKRIKLHYDAEPTNIWYMEMEYDVNGTSFVVGHGNKGYGTVRETVNIDTPSEYIAQIEGTYGTSRNLPNLTVVQTLTIRTNKKTYGPFGREKMTGVGETQFTSDYGRIVGFFGRQQSWIAQIGCFIAHAQ